MRCSADFNDDLVKGTKKRLTGEVISRNDKTTWMRLSDGNTVKRKNKQHNVKLEE